MLKKLFCLFSTGLACLFAQSYVGPRCEPIPEVQKIVQEVWRDTTRPMPGRLDWQAAQWERWLEKYPRETVLHRRYYLLFRDDIPEKVEGIRRQYLERAEKNPKDIQAVYMAGLVLEGVDTPKAIETLERAVKLDPSFGWSYLTLAYLYGRGKSQDKLKAAENMAAYVKACPQNLESFSLSMLNQYGTPETMVSAARSIRVRLEKETDPKTLQSFSDLWGLEFKTTPVAEHSKQRERVAADLGRLERLNPKPDAEWLAFLVDGMKQSGAAKDVPAVEDRIVREFPASFQAFRIVMQRWDAGHPRPKPTDATEVWDRFTKDHTAAVERWMKQFPDQETTFLSMLLDDTTALPPVDPVRLRELGDRLIRTVDVKYGLSATPRIQVSTRAYLRYRVDPARAGELLESARPLMLKERARQLQTDNLLDSDRTEIAAWHDSTELTWAGAMATAYRRAGMGSRAAPLRSLAEAVQPAKPEVKVQRFAALAEIAAAEGKYTDALALYKAALDTRPKAPPVRGRSDDQLLEQAREIWALSGGKDALWALWSKPPERAGREITDSRWEQPRKPLPQFELSDLRGHTWTPQTLEGKTLLINIWATWCGPCMAELPHLQKLYEQTKDRSDVAIFSLNVDDEVGLVEPFMKENSYSFPVLLAASYVNRVVNSLGIPQNWIVDKAGVWQWQQLGYDSDPDWERSMLEKIGTIK